MERETLSTRTADERTSQSEVDTERLDWLDAEIDVRLRTHTSDGNYVHEVSRSGFILGAHPDLRLAIDAARSGSTNAAGGSSHAGSVSPSSSGRASSAPSITADTGELFEKWWKTYAGPFTHKSSAKFAFESGFTAAKPSVKHVPLDVEYSSASPYRTRVKEPSVKHSEAMEEAREALELLTFSAPQPCRKANGSLHQKGVCGYCDGIRALTALQQFAPSDEAESGRNVQQVIFDVFVRCYGAACARGHLDAISMAARAVNATLRNSFGSNEQKMREALRELRQMIVVERDACIEEPGYPRTNQTMRAVRAIMQMFLDKLDSALSSPPQRDEQADSESKTLTPQSGGERTSQSDALDAARYRFLRDRADPDEQQPYIAQEQVNSWGNWLSVPLTPEECDAVIDSARSGSTNPEGVSSPVTRVSGEAETRGSTETSQPSSAGDGGER